MIYNCNGRELLPDKFDAPPLNFEENTDYGWTRIARPIVEMDGTIVKFCKQLNRNKVLEEHWNNLPFMRLYKKRKLRTNKHAGNSINRRNVIRFSHYETNEFKSSFTRTVSSTHKSPSRRNTKSLINSKDTSPSTHFTLDKEERFHESRAIIRLIKEETEKVEKNQKKKLYKILDHHKAIKENVNKSYSAPKYTKLVTFLSSEKEPISKNFKSTKSSEKKKRPPKGKNQDEEVPLIRVMNTEDMRVKKLSNLGTKKRSKTPAISGRVSKARLNKKCRSAVKQFVMRIRPNKKKNETSSKNEQSSTRLEMQRSEERQDEDDVATKPTNNEREDGKSQKISERKRNPYFCKPKLRLWNTNQNFNQKVSYSKKNSLRKDSMRSNDYSVVIGKKSPRMKLDQPVLSKRDKYTYTLM